MKYFLALMFLGSNAHAITVSGGGGSSSSGCTNCVHQAGDTMTGSLYASSITVNNGNVAIGSGTYVSSIAANGDIYMAKNSSITLTGPLGFIQGGSSITASAFFGDASHMSGVTANQVNAGGIINGPLSSSIMPSTSVFSSASSSFTATQNFQTFVSMSSGAMIGSGAVMSSFTATQVDIGTNLTVPTINGVASGVGNATASPSGLLFFISSATISAVGGSTSTNLTSLTSVGVIYATYTYIANTLVSVGDQIELTGLFRVNATATTGGEEYFCDNVASLSQGSAFCGGNTIFAFANINTAAKNILLKAWITLVKTGSGLNNNVTFEASELTQSQASGGGDNYGTGSTAAKQSFAWDTTVNHNILMGASKTSAAGNIDVVWFMAKKR